MRSRRRAGAYLEGRLVYDDAFRSGIHQAFNVTPPSVVKWSGGPGGGPPDSVNSNGLRQNRSRVGRSFEHGKKIWGTQRVMHHYGHFVRFLGSTQNTS